MIEMQLLGVNLGVGEVQGPEGVMRFLRVEDPSGIVVVVPMPLEVAMRIGNQLAGRGLVVPPPGLPATRLPRNNGA